VSERATRLPQYIDIIHAVGQQFLLIGEYFTCLFLVPLQELGALISGHIFRPVKFGFWIRTHIIQIVGRVDKVGVKPFPAC
jgi:hypothetical protein